MLDHDGRPRDWDMTVELGARVARLEEAVSSVKAGQSVMQWACGIAMALMIALTAALLNRTFAVADNIIALAQQTGTVAGSLQAVQSDVLGVKADLREARAEFRSDLGDVRSELGEIRSQLSALTVAVERIAATSGSRAEPSPRQP